MDGKTEEVFVRKDELTEMGLGVPQAVEFYLDLKENTDLVFRVWEAVLKAAVF